MCIFTNPLLVALLYTPVIWHLIMKKKQPVMLFLKHLCEV